MGTQDMLVGVSGGTKRAYPHTPDFPFFKFPICLPRYAFLENCFQMILKCQAMIVVLQTVSALFFLFTQLWRRKSSGSHFGRAGFPAASLDRHPWILEPQEMGDAPKDALLLFLPSPCDPAWSHQVQNISISKKDVHVLPKSADEPSELTPTRSTAQGSCSQPGNKPCCKSR